MTLESIGLWSSTAGAFAYAVLALVAWPVWRKQRVDSSLVLAPLLTSLQFAVFGNLYDNPPLSLLLPMQLVCTGAWWLAALHLLKRFASIKGSRPLKSGLAAVWLALAGACALIFHYCAGSTEQSVEYVAAVMLVLAVISVMTLEQVYRNVLSAHRRALKLVCLGLFAAFGYDLYFAAHALMFRGLDSEMWHARGAAHALAAVLIGAGLLRVQEQPRIRLSRDLAFYSTSLTGSGLFLFAMAAGGYYVRVYGGSWGGVFQVLLFFSALLVTLAAFSSSHARAYLRVLINKNFFNHKYDYREVWLRLISVLSKPIEGGERETHMRAISAIAEIFNSPAGCLWLATDNRQHVPVAAMNMSLPENAVEPVTTEFCKAMRDEEWVFSLSDFSPDPRVALLPPWLLSMKDAWLVLPLNNEDSLIGFMMLTRPLSPLPLTWEDLDILRTTGRQIASFISRHRAAEQLAEAKQFDAYYKLTAFIMHDLKNLIAQQALVVKNAAKHKENPAFIEDAINTIDNSVQRMHTLLKKLQQPEPSALAVNRSTSIQRVLTDAVQRCSGVRPIPSLLLPQADGLVNADHEHLVMILTHLIKNAQEATPESGFVDVRVEFADRKLVISIEDNGQGMDQEFVRNRLFRPFDTTKSGKGMGIGAYQAREFIQGMGGDVKVQSAPGIGTTFTLSIPLSHMPDNACLTETARFTP